jgi:hypothetical protein
LAILVFDVWLRAHTFGPVMRQKLGLSLWQVSGAEGEPLDCDEAVYAYIGHRLDCGDVMYRDLTENKPPLGYWIYAIAVAIGGYNELAIRAMPIPIVLVTIPLVWWIGLRLAGPAAGCLAGALYAVVSTDPFVFGNGANLEHAMNLFAVASLAAMVRGCDAKRASWWFVAAGVCTAGASLVKQVAALHLIVYGIALLLRVREDGSGGSARLRELTALVAGFLLTWLIALGIVIAQGAGPAAYEDIVRFGSAMITSAASDPHAPPLLVRWITGNADPHGVLPWPFGATDYLVWWGTGTWPLWLAAVPALGWLGLGPSNAGRRLVAAWTLSAWVQVALPRQFWQHYYLLPLPGIALALAITAADLAAMARRRTPRIRAGLAAIGLVALIAAMVGTVIIQVREYLLVTPEQLTIRDKGGRQWVTLRALGREIGRRARAWQSPHLYVWGWQSPLHIYSGLDSVSPLCFANDVLKAHAGGDDPLFRPRIDGLMHDLESRQPELIFTGDPPFPALRSFLVARYRPAPIRVNGQRLILTPDGRGLWVRRDVAAAFLADPPAP